MKTGIDFLFLAASGVLFGLFVVDVLLGKAALTYGFVPMMKLGDVGEFLVLLAAVILFVIEVLRRESQAANVKTRSANAAEEENK